MLLASKTLELLKVATKRSVLIERESPRYGLRSVSVPVRQILNSIKKGFQLLLLLMFRHKLSILERPSTFIVG